MDNQGIFVGEVQYVIMKLHCQGGEERYNPNISDENRRFYDNLMLIFLYKLGVIYGSYKEKTEL